MDFKLFEYKCIITPKLIIDYKLILENDIIINIFFIKGLKYFVFSTNKFIYLN